MLVGNDCSSFDIPPWAGNPMPLFRDTLRWRMTWVCSLAKLV